MRRRQSDSGTCRPRKEPPPLRGEITFEHVAFGYDPALPVLRDITFTISPGQMVGIVGPTGSGKSTVVRLIPRFRDPDAGSIKIDGVDICDYTLHGLRCQIGFVLQDTVLLRGTVRDNIAFGRPDATEDQILEAAKLANAHEFITRMADGYDSLVGDRGLTLSGGQRQRIGIARALIRDNPILILDEPTAALDAESEALVIQAMERLMEGRTVITIAHRLSTLRNADKIIVIDNGVVAEDGTHQELLDTRRALRAPAPSAIRDTRHEPARRIGAHRRWPPDRTSAERPVNCRCGEAAVAAISQKVSLGGPATVNIQPIRCFLDFSPQTKEIRAC